MAMFPDRNLPSPTPWQRLNSAERERLMASVVSKVNRAIPGTEQRELGGRVNHCELYTISLAQKFAESAVRLQFAHSSQLEETFGLPYGSLSGRLGHTFGILENEVLFDLTIEQFYAQEDQRNGTVPTVVNELMEKGYIALTDENLFAYAEALAKNSISLQKRQGCKDKFLGLL